MAFILVFLNKHGIIHGFIHKVIFSMLWIKAFHLIFMVTWFSGLFYLPRLYVYHAEAMDEISQARFKTMERKLYYGIATPGGVLTLIFGSWLLGLHWSLYLPMHWLQLKLGLIVLLVIYHVYLGKLLYDFKQDRNPHTSTFYRWLNEVPVIFLVGIILLAVVRP
jgi:putative membrane protein